MCVENYQGDAGPQAERQTLAEHHEAVPYNGSLLLMACMASHDGS